MEKKNKQAYRQKQQKRIKQQKDTEKYPGLKKANINKFCKIAQIDEKSRDVRKE